MKYSTLMDQSSADACSGQVSFRLPIRLNRAFLAILVIDICTEIIIWNFIHSNPFGAINSFKCHYIFLTGFFINYTAAGF